MFYGPLRLADPSAPSTMQLPGQTGYTAYARGQQFTLGGGPAPTSQQYLPFLAQQLSQRLPGASGFTSYAGPGGQGVGGLGFNYSGSPIDSGTLEGIGAVSPESLTSLLSGLGNKATVEDLVARLPVPTAGAPSGPRSGGESSLAPMDPGTGIRYPGPVAPNKPEILPSGLTFAEAGGMGEAGGGPGTSAGGVTGGLGALGEAASNQSLAVAGLNALGVNPSANFMGIPDINILGQNLTPTNKSVANSFANNALSINGINVGALANMGYGVGSALNSPSSLGNAFSVNGVQGYAAAPGQSFFSLSPEMAFTQASPMNTDPTLQGDAVSVATGQNIGFGGTQAGANVAGNFAAGSNLGPQGATFGLGATNPSVQAGVAANSPRANDPIDAVAAGGQGAPSGAAPTGEDAGGVSSTSTAEGQAAAAAAAPGDAGGGGGGGGK